MNFSAKYILDNAEKNPEEIKKILEIMHSRGETVEEVLDFINELRSRCIEVSPPCEGTPNCNFFDVCGTGGSGKSRINLSTVLALKLAPRFKIVKHGNKAASGKVGSFDLIEKIGYPVCNTPEKVIQNIKSKNVAFVFAPAFHPALKSLAPIRKTIKTPTIFNYLGPLLNPFKYMTAQLVGVSNPAMGDILAQVAQPLGKNILFVHDTVFGLDDVSIGGKTQFWKVKDGKIETGTFVPEDYGVERVADFEKIAGGVTVQENIKIFEDLMSGEASRAHLDFLKINQLVAEGFFNEF